MQSCSGDVIPVRPRRLSMRLTQNYHPGSLSSKLLLSGLLRSPLLLLNPCVFHIILSVAIRAL
jgi:hypothetical protein